MHSPENVLEWIIGEISGDHTVEVVTDAMLDRLISNHPHVAAFFYDKNDHEPSMKALKALETIDDDLHDFSKIKLVKIADPEEALEYGLSQLPALVFFEHKLPTIFEGNLENHDEVFDWVTEAAMEDKIELVTVPMLERLFEDYKNIAAFVHDK